MAARMAGPFAQLVFVGWSYGAWSRRCPRWRLELPSYLSSIDRARVGYLPSPLFFTAMTMPPRHIDWIFRSCPGSGEYVDREDDPYRPSRNDRRAITTPLAMGPNALPVQRWD